MGSGRSGATCARRRSRRSRRRRRRDSRAGRAPGDACEQEPEETAAAHPQDTAVRPGEPDGHAGGDARTGGGSVGLGEEEKGARGGKMEGPVSEGGRGRPGGRSYPRSRRVIDDNGGGARHYRPWPRRHGMNRRGGRKIFCAGVGPGRGEGRWALPSALFSRFSTYCNYPVHSAHKNNYGATFLSPKNMPLVFIMP